MSDLDKMFDEMEKQDIKAHPTKGRSSGGILRFEYSEDDSDLMTLLKDLVNNSSVTYNDVYEKYDRRLGWNMINSVRNGHMSWDRFKKWAVVLNVDVEILIKPKE